jgi:hypothetical protein
MITGHSGTTLLDAARTLQVLMMWPDGGLMSLNPSFVEALMGLPSGWTESGRSETQLSLL